MKMPGSLFSVASAAFIRTKSYRTQHSLRNTLLVHEANALVTRRITRLSMAGSMPDSVPYALGLVFCSGAATALGGAVVFFPTLVRRANPKALAASLGLSAGVMIYVSFVEVFSDAKERFIDSGFGPRDAVLYATLSFFLGVAVFRMLDGVVDALSIDQEDHSFIKTIRDNSENMTTDRIWHSSATSDQYDIISALPYESSMATAIPDGITDRAQLFNEMQTAVPVRVDEEQTLKNTAIYEYADVHKSDTLLSLEATTSDRSRKLFTTSIKTALAIALHNFPEGLATFVASLDSISTGATLALAIALHNIPEGLSVAMPVYYATGRRWQAFGWAALSGATEPLAAVLAWMVLARYVSDAVLGTVYGLVAGMMVLVSVEELLPTAREYDPDDHVVTTFFVIGMAIMAVSLVLFAF